MWSGMHELPTLRMQSSPYFGFEWNHLACLLFPLAVVVLSQMDFPLVHLIFVPFVYFFFYFLLLANDGKREKAPFSDLNSFSNAL